jgi:ketosteroid isomerase-like protein
MHRNLLLPLVLFLMAATTIPTAAQSKDEDEIGKADAVWSHAAESKDLDKFVSFYADDASALPFNAPIANGREQIRLLWSTDVQARFWTQLQADKD